MSYQTGTSTDFVDLLTKLATFLALGHSLTPTYTGTGNGRLTLLIGTASSVQETITVTFSSATAFSVSGSVSGSLGSGTVGSPFSSSVVAFTAVAGGTAWVNGDTVAFTMTVPWSLQRGRGGVSFLVSGFTNYFNVFEGTSAAATMSSASLPGWLGFKASAAIQILSVSITATNTPANAPKDFAIEYSDDNSSWTAAQSFTSQTFTAGQTQNFNVSGSPGTHLYWRLRVTAANGGSSCDIAELYFYDAQNSPAANLYPWTLEYIWKAPGNANETSIYVGAKLQMDSGADYWNWRLGGFTGYSAGTSFANQPGAMTSPHLPLWNSSMGYWFMATGRRVIVQAKVSGLYLGAYLGFINSYTSPVTWPYPLLIGGSLSYNSEPAWSSANWRWSISADNLGVWPLGSTNTSWQDANVAGRLRRPDGSWGGIQHSSYTLSNGSAQSIVSAPYVWNTYSTEKGTNIRENLDGTYTGYPIWFMENTNNSTPNIWGEPDGVEAVTGHSNAAENTVAIGTQTHIVFPNGAKTAKDQYFMVRAD